MNKTLHLPSLFHCLSHSSVSNKKKFKSLRTALYNTTQYDSEKAWLIYEQMIQFGVDKLLKANHYGQLLNIMKYGHAENNSVQRMLTVLERMKQTQEPSSYHISQVLYAMSRQGLAKEALKLIKEMNDKSNFHPQTNHYLSLAIALKKSSARDPLLIEESLRLMIEDAEKRDVEINSSIQSTMISLLAHSGQDSLIAEFMKAANESYKRNKCKNGENINDQHYNVHIYTSLIMKFGNEGDTAAVKRLYKEMRKHNIKPTIVTYTSLMNAYGRAGDFSASIQLLEDYERKYKRIENSMVTALLTHAIYHDDLLNAQKAADFITKKQMKIEDMDDRLRTTLLWLKAKNKIDDARDYFDYLYSVNKSYVNHIMVDHLVTGYGHRRDKKNVIDSFNLKNQLGQPLSEEDELRSRHSLVYALFRCGDVSGALGVYAWIRTHTSPDQITAAMVVKGLIMNHEPDLAWRLFKSLQVEGIQPNLHAYSTILKAFGHKHDILTKRKYQTMDIDPSLLESAGIHLPQLDFLHSPVPSTTEALNLFRQMTGFHQPNAFTYTTLIACFAKSNIEKAISIFRHMCHNQVSPTVETYTALIQGCAIFRNSELGLMLFNHMTERQVQPNAVTWRYLLKCLLRSRVDKKEIDRIGSMALKALNKEKLGS
ncbi:hypothetical protein BDB01DRAFT_842113 [Pilobolus umbonatus]|nr:hypothetical protein BDB01DRAFT_842113 [Pilobolus umbonatus]